jgi:hypothetical protein
VLNVLPQAKLTGLGLGEARVACEIPDSQTPAQLVAARISDTGSRFSPSGLSVWGDVEALMKEWSKKLAKRLADARTDQPPS